MRKWLLSTFLLILAVPAMAGVSIEVNDLGGGIAAIEYTSDANVSAFGLKVTVDAGTIVDVNNYHVGESNSVAKGYGIFLGSIDIDAGTGAINNYGTPVAPSSDPGASGTGLGTNTVILELGALYEDGNQPPLSGVLCHIEVSENCKMTVTPDATRCGQTAAVTDAGAVLEDTTAVEIDTTNATGVDVVVSAGCACLFDLSGPTYLVPDGKVNTADFNVLLGDLNYAYYLVGSYTITKGDATTGFLWRDCFDATGDTYMVPDDVIDTKDFNILLGRMNYAYYLYGVYEYTCGDATIDP